MVELTECRPSRQPADRRPRPGLTAARGAGRRPISALARHSSPDGSAWRPTNPPGLRAVLRRRLLAAVAVAVALAAAGPGRPSTADAQPAPAAGPDVTWDSRDRRPARMARVGRGVRGPAYPRGPRRDRVGAPGRVLGQQLPPARGGGRRPGAPPVGDAAQGALESASFDIPGGRLSFLIGGGRSFATRPRAGRHRRGRRRETRVVHATGSGVRHVAPGHLGPDAVRGPARPDPDRRCVRRRRRTG